MAQSENVFETYATTSKSMFDFWVSFFPTAPMFGVEWRFGDLNAVAPAPVHKPEKNFGETKKVAPKTELAPVKEPELKVETYREAASTTKTTDSISNLYPSVEESAVPVKPPLLSERPEAVDPLTTIKGVGPGLEKQLHALGIYTFAQLVDLSEAQLEWLDDNLTTVKGRCIRDDWSGQAKALMT